MTDSKRPPRFEVAQHLADGMSVQQAAHRMGICVNTAYGHVKALKRDMNAKTRLHALAEAMRKGLVQ